VKQAADEPHVPAFADQGMRGPAGAGAGRAGRVDTSRGLPPGDRQRQPGVIEGRHEPADRFGGQR
jgi:hypothetical protein